MIQQKGMPRQNVSFPIFTASATVLVCIEGVGQGSSSNYCAHLTAINSTVAILAPRGTTTGEPFPLPIPAMEWLDEYEKLVIRMNAPRVVIDNAVCPTHGHAGPGERERPPFGFPPACSFSPRLLPAAAGLVGGLRCRKRGVLLEAVQVLADLDLGHKLPAPSCSSTSPARSTPWTTSSSTAPPTTTRARSSTSATPTGAPCREPEGQPVPPGRHRTEVTRGNGPLHSLHSAFSEGEGKILPSPTVYSAMVGSISVSAHARPPGAAVRCDANVPGERTAGSAGRGLQRVLRDRRLRQRGLPELLQKAGDRDGVGLVYLGNLVKRNLYSLGLSPEHG
jgi:hypothetical protein